MRKRKQKMNISKEQATENPRNHKYTHLIEDDEDKENIVGFSVCMYCLVGVCVIFTFCAIVSVIAVASICISIITTTLRLEACAKNVQLKQHNGCNRNVLLCNQTYDMVAHATMHNAFATSQDGFFFAQHRACLRSGLVRGIRGFMLDVYLTPQGTLLLCHYSCILGSLEVNAVMSTFHEFMTNNPREIITIFWELQKAPMNQKIRIKELLHQVMESSGLIAFMHVQHINTSWPTMEEMINNGTRIVSFSNSFTMNDPFWDMYEFDHAFETPFSSLSAKSLTKNCIAHRGSENNSLVVLNHFTLTGAIGINTQVVDSMIGFLGIDIFKAINKQPFMWKRISECQQCLGRIVNFVAVDFWESSDVIEVVQRLNSVNISSDKSKCVVS